MRTTKAWWRLVAVVMALAFTAAACGSDDDDTAADDTSAEETTAEESSSDDSESDDAMEDDEDEAMEEAAPAMISDGCNIPNPAEEVEIDVMGWEFPIITQYAEELEECEDGNYAFNVQFLDSAEAQDAMRLDGSTGSPEFEIYQGSNSFIIELANSGALMPLNDLIDKYGAEYGLDEINPAFFDFNSIDGNIYAIPMVSNTMHLFYNEPALAEIGVEVPTTFEEAFEACSAIQDAGV